MFYYNGKELIDLIRNKKLIMTTKLHTVLNQTTGDIYKVKINSPDETN